MIGICPILFVGWKLLKRTRFHRSDEIDLFKNLDEIEEYERSYVKSPPRYVYPV